MQCTRRLFALSLVALAMAGCHVTMGTFTVPAQVWAGHVFEVMATAWTDGNNGSIVGILQLPDGFTVEGAAGFGQSSSTVFVPDGGRMSPAPMRVAPEPGHFVEGFAGSHALGLGTPQSAALRVFVRAPNAPGNHVLKLALVGSNGVLPADAASFAAITSPPHVATIAVLPDPTGPLAIDMVHAPGSPAPNASCVALADLDHDGLGDLVYTHHGQLAAGLHVLLQRQNGQWQPSPTPPGLPAQRYTGCAVGDFDGDGHEDLADNTGRILFGDGGSTWTPGPTLPLSPPDWDGVVAADVDGDGRDDLALSARTTDAVMVFLGRPGRTFVNGSGNLPNGTNGPAGANRLQIADVTGDGRADLVVGGGLGLRVFEGHGPGQWLPRSSGLPGYPNAGMQGQFVLSDIDGDRLPELLTFDAPALRAYRYTGATWQVLTLAIAGSPPPFGGLLSAADIDGDGLDELTIGNATGYPFGPPALLRNLGNSFAAPEQLVTTLTSQSHSPFAVGDLDGDTWPDLAGALAGEGLFAWYGTGSGSHPFGNGCGAPGRAAPVTTAIGQPTLGNTAFAIGLQGASPAAPAVLWLGWSRHAAHGAPLPLDLTGIGAPGCAIWAADASVAVVVADPAGLASMPLSIPNDPALRRLLLFAQGATAAPGSNALGWLFGQGLAIRVP